MNVANKFKNLITAHLDSLDPTPNNSFQLIEDDDATVVTSNRSRVMSTEHYLPPTGATIPHIATAARTPFDTTLHQRPHALTNASTHAIADTGATSIFIMEGTDVVNKTVALQPITINLPDGRRVMSTHVCDITIPGLPTILVGHIIPHLAVASLIGIRPLCKAGCTVTFDNDKCDVIFKGEVILQGFKNVATDLWTLPINPGHMPTAQQ